MIDYGATDGSQELIKKYAPHWEIRPTKNKYFEEPGITKEVIEIEINLQSHHLLQIYHFLDYPDIA